MVYGSFFWGVFPSAFRNCVRKVRVFDGFRVSWLGVQPAVCQCNRLVLLATKAYNKVQRQKGIGVFYD